MEEKIVIDESIKDTLELLRADPSLFTTKDYFHALPMDYSNDPIYAILQSAVMFDVKLTLSLMFSSFVDKDAKNEFSNEKFKTLYYAALKANMKADKVDENIKKYAPYLAFVYAYAQIVKTKEGLSEEENNILISQFLKKIETDNSFINKFYTDEERTEVLEQHRPSFSFVAAFNKFGENIYADKDCYKLFNRVETESVLNQYLDDMYSLFFTNDNKDDYSFFRRFNVKDDSAEFLKEYQYQDVADEILMKHNGNLRAAIMDAVFTHPIYHKNGYNFSYMKAAMNMISDNFDELVELFNTKNKTPFVLGNKEIKAKNKAEIEETAKRFISTYIVALFADKQKKGDKTNDPFGILEPNIKVNFLKTNEKIFEKATSFLSKDEINEFVLGLEQNAVELANLIEQTENFKLPNISTRTVVRLILKHLEKQEQVFLKDINELERVKDHKDNGRKFKSDEVVLLDCFKKYTDGKAVDVDSLIKIVTEQQRNYFVVARHGFLKPKVYGQIGRLIARYARKGTPEFIKNDCACKIDGLVEVVLDTLKCNDQPTRKLFKNIFSESLHLAPILEEKMFESLLKSMQITKMVPIVRTFKEYLTPTLMMSPKENPVTKRIVEEITTEESLPLTRKFFVKDIIQDDLFTLSKQLKIYGNYKEAKELEQIIYNLDKVMSTEDKKAVKNELKSIYNKLSKEAKENADIPSQDLVRHVPALLKKVPTTKQLAKQNLIEFICYLNPDDISLEETLQAKLRYVTENDKASFKALVSEEFYGDFERLWKEIPKSSQKVKEKNVFLSTLRNIIKNMPMKLKEEYMDYFDALFPTPKTAIKTENKQDEKELEKYKKYAKQKLIELVNHNQDIAGVSEMEEILNQQ